MKTTELNYKSLMIEDLVSYNGVLIKVENIHGDCINYSPDIPYVQEEFFIDIADIKPIPLTPEILEKNGFEYKDGWAEWWHRSEDGFGSDFQLSITESGFFMQNIGNAKINFVHQLQHALRLCGLDELADNLKME